LIFDLILPQELMNLIYFSLGCMGLCAYCFSIAIEYWNWNFRWLYVGFTLL